MNTHEKLAKGLVNEASIGGDLGVFWHTVNESIDSDPFGVDSLIKQRCGKLNEEKRFETLDFPPGFSPNSSSNQKGSNSCSKHVDDTSKHHFGFSMVERLEETIKVGLALVLNMEGCESTIASLIAVNGELIIALWSSLASIIDNWGGNLVVMGDFNEVRKAGGFKFTCVILEKGILDHRPILFKDFMGASEEDFINRRDSTKILDEIQCLETKDLAQKAKIKWAIEGDENSSFFHGTLKKKQRQQAINGILKNGDWIEDPFKDCGGDRAPRPDGFSFKFLKTFWDLPKEDVVHFVHEFFHSGSIPKGSNPSFMALIPKVSNAKFVNDFRAISLIGCQCKIIGKLLANRLSTVIGSCTSTKQSTFIKGRNILDGPLILNEVMSWYQKRKKELMMFKVYFEKAFDVGLSGHGFGKTWLWDKVAFMDFWLPSQCSRGGKYRDSVAFATGCRRIKNCKRCNHKIRIPIGMWPCRVEEKMTLKEVDGKTVEEIETTIIAKDGTVTRIPGKFQGYETSEEEPVEQPRRHDLYGFVDHPQLQQGNPMNEFAPHRLPQPEGNMNGWLMEDEEELERNEVDSDLESTASRGSTTVKGGIYNYGGQHNYTCATTQVDLQALHKMAPTRRSGPNNNENPDIAAIIAQQLQTILPQIVTQVTNNMNNANGGNGGNVTPEYPRFKRYIAGLAPEIRGMLRATQPTTIQSAILIAGILTDEAISYGTLTKEVADGKKVEVDRIIRDCKLELGSSLFSINLIPLGHGSFDVIVGMDWLSQHKAVIVCHEKVVEIPVEDGRTLRVHGERTVGIAKALKSVKEDEPKLGDISVVRDFEDVFPEDLSGIPPQRQVEFHIDLVPGATPIAKSPYRLAPSEMQELSGQLQELQDKGFIRPSYSPWGASMLFVKKKDGSLCMCIDYRELNKLTVKNCYPLSRIDDLFDHYKDHVIFHDSFDQTKEDHEVHLGLVLELLRKEKLYAKFSKCEFWLQEVHFLGHVVNQNGIHVDPSKIEAVKNWKTTMPPSEIRAFVGLAVNYARDYECEIRYHPSKANVVADALSRKERLKPRRVRAMAMTIQTGMREKIQTAQSEALKQENILAESLHGLDQQMEKKEGESLYFMDQIWVSLVGGVRTVIMDEAHKSKYLGPPGED
ncbi:putative reverse transcriptase domain-containing protein [Tanacetum coccineum]|uniref:Reverse transcriptase domain-containing protein n=1 Tax=Tanacetum coccineum TaxID=301880 RepID=A0ABQ4ZCP6_9ASTR